MSQSQVKICKECGEEKSIEAFAPNQFGKDNRVLRRPVCRVCYSKKVKADPKQKRLFEEQHPRPEIGDMFSCPICIRTFRREHNNDVVLDHSHKDGSIRGYLCSSCNTSLGKFGDNVEVLQRAIDWINSHGNG